MISEFYYERFSNYPQILEDRVCLMCSTEDKDENGRNGQELCVNTKKYLLRLQECLL